jgi:hypothetical protein
MILYLKDPKNTIKKSLDLINTFSKVTGYEINIQKPVAVLYINHKQAKKEIRKAIPFTIASKKYLGTNLTKELK